MAALATFADIWMERYAARRGDHGWRVFDTASHSFVEFDGIGAASRETSEALARQSATRLNAQHAAARTILAGRVP